MLIRDRQAWLHSAKSFLAAALALWIGLRFDLPRPYWAMATAYIVIQPVLGGTRARGVYRISGTFIAAAGVVLLVPPLIQAPALLSLALSLWLSVFLFVAMLHRGPSGYTFMLAGYTIAIIGFPAVMQPEAIFGTAVARAEEITIGSLCAVLVGAVVFPVSIKPLVQQRVDALLRDAAAWCSRALGRKGAAAALRKQLAAGLAQLDAVIPFAKRDDPRHGEIDEWLQELRARMLGLLPVLASIEHRLDNLGAAAQDEAGLRQLLDDLRDWINRGGVPAPGELDAFRLRIAALRPGRYLGDGDELLRDSLLLRLAELVELWHDGLHLRESIATGAPPPPAAFGLDLRGLLHPGNRHRDWAMLAFSALAPGATLFAYCLVWIGLGWPDGASGAMMAAVAASFFAAQDDPTPSILAFLVGMVVSIVVSGVYLFGILPAIHDFVPLLLALAPLYLLLGLLLSRPRYFSTCTLLLVNSTTLLSLQDGGFPGFEAFSNAAVSTVLGLLFALIVTQLFRSVGAEWTARRLVRQGWQSLAEAADGRGQQDRDRFMMRMLDLLGLLAPRLATLPAESDLAAVDMLDEVRIGLNIISLRRARNQLPEVNRGHLNRLLADVAAHYRARQRAGRPLPPPVELKNALDTSLSHLRELPAGLARDDSLIGLVGLRYGLFPKGTDFAAPTA